MARLARVVAVGIPHHVTQRGNDRQTVFATDLDRARYVEALAFHCEKQHISVPGYCLMTNHVHLVAAPILRRAWRSAWAALTIAHHDYARVSTAATGAAATCGRTALFLPAQRQTLAAGVAVRGPQPVARAIGRWGR